MPHSLLINGTPSNLFAMTVTIAAGASTTEIFTLQGMALIGIYVPSGWTAASIGYRTCLSGNPTDLVTAYDSSGNLEQSKVSTDAAAATVYITIPQTDTLFVPWMQLASVVDASPLSNTAVLQVAARTLTLIFRNYLS